MRPIIYSWSSGFSNSGSSEHWTDCSVGIIKWGSAVTDGEGDRILRCARGQALGHWGRDQEGLLHKGVPISFLGEFSSLFLLWVINSVVEVRVLVMRNWFIWTDRIGSVSVRLGGRILVYLASKSRLRDTHSCLTFALPPRKLSYDFL